MATMGEAELRILTLFVMYIICPKTVHGEPLASACVQYTKPGNITLAGIFPLRRSSSTEFCIPGTTYWGLQLSEAMMWAIDQVNNRDDILPDLTIGYDIRDDCRTEDSALWTAMSLFTDTCKHHQETSDIMVGIIGGAFSSTSVFIAKVANIFKIPFISFSATSDELSDKERFPYFLRTLPPDRYQIQVFMDIILKYNWRYIALVYSADTYGIHGARQIKSLAEENDVCIALSEAVQPYAPQNEIDDVIGKLRRVPKAKVVIIFSLDDVANTLISTIHYQQLNWNITWIASDGWGYGGDLQEWSATLVGSLLVRFRRPRAPAFERYFSRLDPRVRVGSSWYHEYWNDWMRTQGCSDITQCPYDIASKGGPVIDAVNAFANAIHDMYVASCHAGACLTPDAFTGAALLEYLFNVQFNATAGPMNFDEYGDTMGKYVIQNVQRDEAGYRLVDAGYWDARNTDVPLVIDSHLLQFAGELNEPPYSLCREDCALGYIVVPLEQKCCYGCQKCPANAVIIHNSTVCKPCSPTHWPDEVFQQCNPIEPTLITILNPIILLIVVLTVGGLWCCALTVVGLCLYRSHPLVKATSRELSAVNLSGLSIAFLGVVPLLLKPTVATCMFSEAFISLSFTMMFAPTLLKVTRIYRIFRAGKQSAQRPKFIGPKDQLLMVFLLICFQILIIIIFAAIQPPSPMYLPSTPPTNYIEIYCDFSTGFAISVAYNFIVIFGCCVLAFQARRVPSNYNESKFIGISVYSTMIVSMAAVPVYSTAVFVLQKVATLCMVLLLNAYLTLVCVYIPKLYAIRFVQDDLNLDLTRTAGTEVNASTISRPNRVDPLPVVE